VLSEILAAASEIFRELFVTVQEHFGYGLDDRGAGVRVPIVNNFLFSTSSRPALGSTQRPIQWVPEVKRPGREVDHSPPTSAEVTKMWTYISTALGLHECLIT
jgi:hypothetical protein